MKRSIVLLATFLAVLFVIRVACAADDWPQWRGVHRDGHSADTGLLKEWPAGGPNLVWKATGLGEGYTNVSIAGDRIYLMGDVDDASSLIALNRADGNKLWTAKAGKAGDLGLGRFLRPALHADRRRQLGHRRRPVWPGPLRRRRDRRRHWRKDYEKDFGAQRPEWGFTCMPLVDGNNVILAPGGKGGNLVAVDKHTGKLVWRSKEFNDSIHYSSPLLVEIGGVRQIVQLTEKSVGGVRASDGKLLWRYERKGNTAVIPTPIFHDDEVYVTSGYGAGCNLFKIAPKEGGRLPGFTAIALYANKEMINHHGGVVLVDKYLYGFSDGKGWTCMDFQTGNVAWRDKGIGKGSLVYADGLLCLRSEEGPGTVAIIEASPDGYKELSRFNPPNRSDKNSWPHPVITGGRLYLRDQDVLLCYDVKGK